MYSTYHSIKSWAEEDRPREKLLKKGRQALSKSELLAILFGSGSYEESAVALSQRLLKSFNQDLLLLSKASVADLQKFKGIGPAKAITLIAALELGRRKKQALPTVFPQISSSQDAYNELKHLFDSETVELFYIALLNQNNRLYNVILISKGGITGTVVDPKIIFKHALDNKAVSILLSHNHPSGNLKPSQADRNITKKLVEAGKMLDMKIMDHLIISEFGYTSFADEGWL